ncbi:MAG: hypothetical protein Q7R56_03605 [Nanoarchaeota archaeon]|nr:hypothetical protein [Nanoarchaeota archaeon]
MNKKALLGLGGFDVLLIIITFFAIAALAMTTYNNQQIPDYQASITKETTTLINTYTEGIHAITYHEQLTNQAACSATQQLLEQINNCNEQCPTTEEKIYNTYLPHFTTQLYKNYATAPYHYQQNWYKTYIEHYTIKSYTTPTLTLGEQYPYTINLPLNQPLPFPPTTIISITNPSYSPEQINCIKQYTGKTLAQHCGLTLPPAITLEKKETNLIYTGTLPLTNCIENTLPLTITIPIKT